MRISSTVDTTQENWSITKNLGNVSEHDSHIVYWLVVYWTLLNVDIVEQDCKG